MSSSFEGYLIPIPALRSFIGSRDAAKVAQIQATITGNPAFQFFTMEGGGNFGPAIQALADGNVEGHDGVSVLIAIRAFCHTFGEQQDNDLLSGVSIDLLDELGSGAKRLFLCGSPVSLDSPTQKFKFHTPGLGIGFLKHSEIPPLLEELNQILDDFPHGSDGKVMETIETVIGWYEGAIESERDLIGFTL